MSSTINNAIDFVPESTIDPAAGLNLSLNQIDALLQVAVIAIQNAPPGSPAEGDRYIVGTGSGAWAGHDDEMARYLDGAWEFYETVAIVFNLTDNKLYLNTFSSAGWINIAHPTNRYDLPFGSADLDSSGILTVTHGLSEQYIIAMVYNASDVSVDITDKVDVSAGANSCSIDLSAETVGASGWHVVIKK